MLGVSPVCERSSLLHRAVASGFAMPPAEVYDRLHGDSTKAYRGDGGKNQTQLASTLLAGDSVCVRCYVQSIWIVGCHGVHTLLNRLVKNRAIS
jgi:hypothetical protein